VSQTDDIARVTRELWRLNLTAGFQRRMGWEHGLGRVAKAAGATEEQVQSWLDGSAMPTTAQALAVLDTLPLPVVGIPAAALNGKGH
jgi:hypothetical protein